MLLLGRYVGVPQLRPLLLQGCLRRNQPFKLQQWTKQSNRLKPQWFSAGAQRFSPCRGI
jgi:hypothetical protein